MNTVPQVRFKSQRPNEIVLLETRRHWWSWVRWMIIPIGLMLLLWVLSAVLQPIAPILIFMSLIFPITLGVYFYADWSNDSLFVTDQRIVRETNNILRFSRQVSEIPITSVQEINADIPNWDLFAILFRYGLIDLKTSGQAGDVKLTMIPDPEGVQSIIINNFGAQQNRQTQQQQDAMRQNLQQWVQQGNATTPFGNGNLQVSNKEVGNAPWSPFVSSFTTQNGGTVYRKHWLIWLQHVFLAGVFTLAGFVVFLVLTFANLGVVGFGIGFVMMVIGAIWFYFSDWDWRNDLMTVTDATVTIEHQRPLWLQNEKDVILLKRVDNIIAESQGFFNQLLNKGTLRFALIGGDSYKEFSNVSYPLDIQADLTRRQGIVKRAQAEEQNAQQQQMIGQYISMYHEMTGAPRPQGQAPTPQGFYPTTQPAPQQPVQPPPSTMQANPFRDANRPPIVPQQRPALSQGRPYAPNTTPFGNANAPQPPARPLTPQNPPNTRPTIAPTNAPYTPPLTPQNPPRQIPQTPPPATRAPFPRGNENLPPPPENPPSNRPPRFK